MWDDPLTSQNLQRRHERQQQQHHRQQLPETPQLLALVAQRDVRRAECLAHHDHAGRCAQRERREHEDRHDAHVLAPPLLPHVQVPRAEEEDDARAGDDGDGGDDGEGAARLRALGAGVLLPDAGDGQRGREGLRVGLQHEDAVDDGQDKVDEHGELAQPAQEPVALEVLHEGEQGGEGGGGAAEGEQPDDEEVVGDHAVDARQADDLDGDALDDLLVGDAVEDLARDVGAALGVDLFEDDEGGEEDGEAGRGDEGEEDLRGGIGLAEWCRWEDVRGLAYTCSCHSRVGGCGVWCDCAVGESVVEGRHGVLWMSVAVVVEYVVDWMGDMCGSSSSTSELRKALLCYCR